MPNTGFQDAVLGNMMRIGEQHRKNAEAGKRGHSGLVEQLRGVGQGEVGDAVRRWTNGDTNEVRLMRYRAC
jgi:hypothetical protein